MEGTSIVWTFHRLSEIPTPMAQIHARLEEPVHSPHRSLSVNACRVQHSLSIEYSDSVVT